MSTLPPKPLTGRARVFDLWRNDPSAPRKSVPGPNAVAARYLDDATAKTMISRAISSLQGPPMPARPRVGLFRRSAE